VTVGRLEASKDAKQKSEVAAATATKKKTTGSSSSTSSSSRRRGAKSAEDELASLFADLSCRDVADEIHILDSSIKSQQASAPSWQKQIDGLPKVLASQYVHSSSPLDHHSLSL
jgi:BRCT domain type II-containing protein